MRPAWIGLVLLAPVLLGTAGDQPAPAKREILALQDQRSLGGGKLVAYLAHRDPDVVALAATALANIQDRSALSSLVPLLRHGSPDVRAAGAFAIGQIGDSSGQTAVLQLLEREKHSLVTRRALEAIGKIGNADALDSLAVLSLNDQHPNTLREQALSLARFALRGIRSEAGARLAFRRSTDRSPEVRWAALYALWRMSPHRTVDSLMRRRSADLGILTGDRFVEVRSQAATLLGRSKTRESYRLLRELSSRELPGGNWRVGVQIARSAVTWLNDEAGAAAIVEAALRSSNAHIRTAALSGMVDAPAEAVAKAKTRKSLIALVDSLVTGRRVPAGIRGEALVVLARLAPARIRLDDEMLRRDPGIEMRPKVLQAASLIPTIEHLRLMMENLEHDQPRVAAAAWEYLPRLLEPVALNSMTDTSGLLDALPAELVRTAKRAFLREDLAITATAAASVRDSSVADLLRSAAVLDELVEILMLTYTQLSSPMDVEPMQELLRTLGAVGDDRCVPVLERALADADRTVAAEAQRAYERVTGSTVNLPSRPVRKVKIDAYDWKSFDRIGPKTRVVVTTERGTFRFSLLKEHAPFTVLKFVGWVRSGFYDGLTFHRVVPNFVTQGGDPRGDGWGGPGYALRTEVSAVNFRRGSVGMASAGKDTEGCQFFITHSPQPHLDGRYTLFGEVLSGMEVVDALQPGNRILRIRLEE